MRLGDAVATVFQPVARGIDSVLGTDIQNCGGCKDRPYFSQRALNALTDQVFALFVKRGQDNDTSPMDYTVTKQVSVQFVVTGAEDDQDAIAKAQKGEGQRGAQGAQNWTAVVRQPPQPQIGQQTGPRPS